MRRHLAFRPAHGGDCAFGARDFPLPIHKGQRVETIARVVEMGRTMQVEVEVEVA